MFKEILIITSLILNPILSQAAVVGLGTPSNYKEFQKYLAAIPENISLKDAIIKNKIKRSDKYISSKYALAVKGLLISDLTPSTYLFKELASSKKNRLFSKKSKDLISESYFRVSNLERTNSNFWIKEGLFFDLNYEPSSTIFNPDIISSFNLQKTEISNYSFDFDISDIVDAKSNVFINGSLTAGTVKIHPSATYHISVFKNGFKSKKIETTGQGLLKKNKIKLQKLSLGNCKEPDFKIYDNIQVTEIFFSKDCIKKLNPLKKIVKKGPVSKKTFHSDITKNPLKTPFYKKKSTWLIAAGVIATAVLVASLNNDKDVKIVPVQR